MFKKRAVISATFTLIMLGFFLGPSAAQVTSISKRGSLLVFPWIQTRLHRDTIVSIGNDAASTTWVKCYWMDIDQNAWDFEFPLTANQAVWFSAKTGIGSISVSAAGDDIRGELRCWAIDINPPAPSTTEELKKFNCLYGSAIWYIDDTVVSIEYPAWAFALNSSPLDPAGPLNLNGTEYDYCPSSLVFNFFAYGAPLSGLGKIDQNAVFFSTCQQDLRQDKRPVCTKAKFDVWNENESKLTGAYQCANSYLVAQLKDIGSRTWENCDLGTKCEKTGYRGITFTYDALHTALGRFRVSPELSTACNNVFSKLGQDGKTAVDVCAGNQIKTPFIGHLVTGIDMGISGFGMPLTTGTQAGQFTAGAQIKWDAAEIVGATKR
jgi:hypothetical protein